MEAFETSSDFVTLCANINAAVRLCLLQIFVCHDSQSPGCSWHDCTLRFRQQVTWAKLTWRAIAAVLPSRQSL